MSLYDAVPMAAYDWEPLVEYLKELADKYGVPQPTW